MNCDRFKSYMKLPQIKALLTTVFLLALIGVGKFFVFDTGLFNPLKTALNNFHFSDIYFYWQKDFSNDVDSEVVIVNTAYLHDRDEIATVVDSINAHHPRAVAVDVVFSETVSTLAAADSHLAVAFNACPNLVLAQRAVLISKNKWNIERSFFAEGNTEGVANFSTALVRTVCTTETFGQETFPTFAAQVVKKVGVFPTEKERIIHFGGIDFMVWTPKESFNLDYLEDKIVIVGDTSDLRDWHDIPIGTTGRSRMSGVELHALSVITLMSDNIYHSFPKFWSIVIQIAILYLFSLIFCCVSEKWKNWDNWIQGALQILLISMILPFCYVLFLIFNLICSPSLTIVGFGLVGFAKDITDAITADKATGIKSKGEDM